MGCIGLSLGLSCVRVGAELHSAPGFCIQASRVSSTLGLLSVGVGAGFHPAPGFCTEASRVSSTLGLASAVPHAGNAYRPSGSQWSVRSAYRVYELVPSCTRHRARYSGLAVSSTLGLSGAVPHDGNASRPSGSQWSVAGRENEGGYSSPLFTTHHLRPAILHPPSSRPTTNHLRSSILHSLSSILSPPTSHGTPHGHRDRAAGRYRRSSPR